jgi:hypothetical protein
MFCFCLYLPRANHALGCLVGDKKVLPKFGHVKNWDYAKIEIIKFCLVCGQAKVWLC